MYITIHTIYSIRFSGKVELFPTPANCSGIQMAKQNMNFRRNCLPSSFKLLILNAATNSMLNVTGKYNKTPPQ
ncbi:hypothetical protein SAMN04487930_109131 [Cytophaga hutchinsonii ATCC 33406]|nr:hypothetical protein SAMN04487930_109131 [Cytophaga hutchinsonii ATCC 33406]